MMIGGFAFRRESWNAFGSLGPFLCHQFLCSSPFFRAVSFAGKVWHKWLARKFVIVSFFSVKTQHDFSVMFESKSKSSDLISIFLAC